MNLYIIFKNNIGFYSVLFFFTAFFINAQKSISGKIIESNSQIPIHEANISLSDTSIGTISNSEGDFVLYVPENFEKGELVISHLGYETLYLDLHSISEIELFTLVPSAISLEEIVVISKNKLDANTIVKLALGNLEKKFFGEIHLLKGFLRHSEKNVNEYKWLIETAFTVFDSGFNSKEDTIRIQINEIRKSYDFRNIDSIQAYRLYLNKEKGIKFNRLFRKKFFNPDTVSKAELTKSIVWYDQKTSGLNKLLNGKLNLLRNHRLSNSILNQKTLLDKHKFVLDSIFSFQGREIYKIKITPSKQMIDLMSDFTFEAGYVPVGWIEIYRDNYAFKEITYALIPASKAQKARSKVIFNSTVNHSLKIKFQEFENYIFPKYLSYKTPKWINNIFRPNESGSYDKDSLRADEDKFYYVSQEILFSEVVTDRIAIDSIINNVHKWNSNIFVKADYNEDFWKSYNVLLESSEEMKMIKDIEVNKKKLTSDN